MTTKFLDGPAARKTLILQRAPMVLRVVVDAKGKIDALDMPGDAPRPDETLYAYIMNGPVGSQGYLTRRDHASGRRLSSFFQSADYRMLPVQPEQDEMKSYGTWSAWCGANKERLAAEYAKAFATAGTSGARSSS